MFYSRRCRAKARQRPFYAKIHRKFLVFHMLQENFQEKK